MLDDDALDGTLNIHSRQTDRRASIVVSKKNNVQHSSSTSQDQVLPKAPLSASLLGLEALRLTFDGFVLHGCIVKQT
jgi:hypothetical protein